MRSSTLPDPVAALSLLAERGPVQLLVTDVVMPRSHGDQPAARLRAEQPGLPVLFVSGYAAAALGGRLPAGTRLLQKPFSPDELLRHVRETLDAPSG